MDDDCSSLRPLPLLPATKHCVYDSTVESDVFVREANKELRSSRDSGAKEGDDSMEDGVFVIRLSL